tara:strand:- start:718 stop:1035 length:318 start_codon:yes stop_codon:yes gene_type:complete
MNIELKEAIIKNLKEVFDPEISVNVYDLGLIYNINIISESKVDIVMTLTSAFCPVAQDMPVWIKDAVLKVESIKDCNVEVTMDPPWGPDKMSEEAKLALGVEENQ